MLVSFFAMDISDFSYFIVIKLLKISDLSKFSKDYLMLKILNNDKFTTAQNRHFLVSLKTPILNTLRDGAPDVEVGVGCVDVGVDEALVDNSAVEHVARFFKIFAALVDFPSADQFNAQVVPHHARKVVVLRMGLTPLQHLVADFVAFSFLVHLV